MRKAITSLLVLVALTACSPGEPLTPTVERTAGPSPVSPSSTVHRATAKQYAILVGPTIKRIRDIWAKFERNDCATAGTLPCRLTAATLEMEAQTLYVSLTEVPDSIGAPPEELESLVADTVDAAKAVDVNIDAEGNVDPLQLPIAMGDLLGVFDKWEPYL